MKAANVYRKNTQRHTSDIDGDNNDDDDDKDEDNKIVHDNKPHMTTMMKITATQNNKRNISKIHVSLILSIKM